MLEVLLNPRKSEKHPWEMFFVGIFYASISAILVRWIFSKDIVLSRYSGILIVTFTVMLSMPFIYYIFRQEESMTVRAEGFFKTLKNHEKTILSLMWLFIGFVVAFSIFYSLYPAQSFSAQIETYCAINKPSNYNGCVAQYGLDNSGTNTPTGSVTSKDKIFMIFANNIYVLIFTIVFSLIFGAGAIFVLAWNASVIAAAIGIYTKAQISALPLGLARYMIHGVPEIASYFLGALAGGIISVAIVKKEIRGEGFWNVMQDSLNLVILAVVVLFIAALIEVFFTPLLF